MTEFLLGILMLIGFAIFIPNYIKWIEKTFNDNDIDGITKHNQNNMEEVFLKLTREKYEFK